MRYTVKVNVPPMTPWRIIEGVSGLYQVRYVGPTNTNGSGHTVRPLNANGRPEGRAKRIPYDYAARDAAVAAVAEYESMYLPSREADNA